MHHVMFNFFMTVYVAIAFDSLLVIMEWVGANFCGPDIWVKKFMFESIWVNEIWYMVGQGH